MEFIEYGRVKYRAALKDYAQCLVSGLWPSYPTRDRIVYGNLQYLDPKALFKYRESGGVAIGRTADYKSPQPPDDRLDVGS
jgi:hypothetical protein